MSNELTILQPQRLEPRTLAECERAVERGFVEAGRALMEIRDGRLYRESYPTFEAYCSERWGWTRRSANYYIEAAEVVGNIGGKTSSQPSVYQAVALAPLPPEQQRELAERIDFATATVREVRQEVREVQEVTSRPPSKTTAPEKRDLPTLGPPRNGMQFARLALMDLEQIREDDLERVQAFQVVRRWLDERA